MKRIKLLFAAFTLVSGITLSSCNKQTETTPVSHTQKSTARTAASKDPVDIGALHNEGMEYFVEHADFKDAMKEVDPLTTTFCEDKGYDADALAEVLSDPDMADIIACRDESALQAWLKRKEMKTESDFLSSMVTAIHKSSGEEETLRSLAIVAEKIEASKDLCDESKTALLQGIAVGKSSTSYCYKQAALGKESAWVVKASAATGIDAEKTALGIDWVAVIVKDVVGGLSGFLTNSWPGAGIGAIKASATELLRQMED